MSVSAPSRAGTESGLSSNPFFHSSSGTPSVNFKFASQSSHSELNPGSATGEAGALDRIVWGTDIAFEQCKREFIEFIRESKFTLNDAETEERRVDIEATEELRSLYLIRLEEISHVYNEPYLILNCAHLREFNPNLCRQLLNYPDEILQIFSIAATELFQELYPNQILKSSISVRPYDADRTSSIRSLNCNDLSKLVTINGMVTRCSQLIPEMIEAFFQCSKCLATRTSVIVNHIVDEPQVCTDCNSKLTFVLIHNRCSYKDKQLVKLQESPEDMPAGETPATITLVACEDLIDKVSPGDRIIVSGIFKGHPIRVNPKIRKVKTVYRTLIDVLHYRRVVSGRLHDQSVTLKFDAERIDKVRQLSRDENLYSKLANSLCPSIFGHENLKKGVLLQLFGGTHKESVKTNEPKHRHFRSEINILLCGDPGTSKSQILQHVYKLVPRGQYTSGKGSSAVGLTAYITKDIDTRQMVLQTGALVMCDGGIVCIDEFDKMDDSTRSILHEVMEQQTLSIAKAGIVCQLNARTSVLAGANPIGSKWNPDKTILENIRLPDTLLSRFDLIFLVLDPDNDEYDSVLAKHLISMYFHEQNNENNHVIPYDLIRDYIAYAKTNIEPKLSEEANQTLMECYLNLRRDALTKGKVAMYPRNLESLIRLSEAHARLRLSPVVEASDVLEANRLYKVALKHSSTDPDQGKIIPGMEVEN